MYIPEEDMIKIRKMQMEMLLEFDRICRKNNLKYVLFAGTLLGAVRHKGYIPWDDDIDVAMLRSEYEKFCSIVNREMDLDKYFFQSYKTDPNYRWAWGRILKNNTEYIREGHEKLKQKTGIFIDIFPLDGIPQGVIAKKLHRNISVLCRKALYAPIGFDLEKRFVKRIGFGLLKDIPSKVPFKILEYLAKKYNEDNCQKFFCLGIRRSMHIYGKEKLQKIGKDKSWFTDLIEMKFEGHYFFVPRNYHELLVEDYGSDYMKLPPEEKRTSRNPASFYRLE